MNLILRNALRAIYSDADDDKGGGGGGSQQQQQQQQQTNTTDVKPEDARKFLVEFGHAEESLKGMKDEDVLKLHGDVNAKITKNIEAHGKTLTEKQKQEQEAARKAVQEKWQKGELKLELPKDSKLTQADVDEIAATARERGLSQDEAAAMLAERGKTAAAFEARAVEQFKAERGKWVEQVKNDPEIGGEKLAETQRLAMLAIERFYPQELRDYLRASGFGDHPYMVRLARSIGEAMSEDQPGKGGGIGGGGKKAPGDVLYGAEKT